MRIRIAMGMFAAVALAAQVPQAAQSDRPPRAAVDVTAADLRATLKQAPAAGVMDQQIRVVDMGKYNVAVGVLHRAAKAKQTAIEHAQVTEVYYIIEGTGTFVTGGTMVDPTPSPAEGTTVKILVGPSTNGASIRGGQSRTVSPGDVIVIPPGVAHWFSAVESDMNYLVVRVDGDHVLPGGYVNPIVGR
ncbi:MAG TPA: cupin domain-containing protein [Vicinamibacterales bacterium]|nr:cupin domain-containing protein [Vicinamibacterales bacterium]